MIIKLAIKYLHGKKVFSAKHILCKTESRWHNEPWTFVSIHTNGTIRVKCGNKSERLNKNK
jgi:hypothetical protein